MHVSIYLFYLKQIHESMHVHAGLCKDPLVTTTQHREGIFVVVFNVCVSADVHTRGTHARVCLCVYVVLVMCVRRAYTYLPSFVQK